MDERQQIQEIVKKYCHEKMGPFLDQDDETETFRKEIFTGLGPLGLGGITTPEDYGGAGLGYGNLCSVLEVMGGTSVAYAITLSVSSMVQSMISRFGTEAQKEQYLPELAQGREIGAFSLSEFVAGSDIKGMITRAHKRVGGYSLKGTKAWVSSAGVAKTYIVMAKTGEKEISAFIVEANREGFLLGKKEKKMGWRISPTRELIFEDCFVPEESLLGKEGEGGKMALSALDGGRITVGAIAVGLAQRAFDESLKYSLAREQFGQPLFRFQGLQFMLADMATEIEASRLLVYRACESFDSGESRRDLAAMAKLKASDVCMRVTTDAIQIHGAIGITCEYPLERFMRDAKILQIVEGTNQIQKQVIGKNLQRKFSQVIS